MKVRSIAVILFLCSALTSCVQTDQGPPAVTLPEPESPYIAFNIWIKSGSTADPEGKEGLAALTASLLEDGSTLEDSYEKIIEKLYPMAAGYTSSVDKEMTVFRGFVHRDNLDEYYGLFKNAILAPAWKEEDFNRIKIQTMSYLEQSRRFSSDEELGKELLSRELFLGTAYEHPEEGYVQSVKAIGLEDVKGFYAQNYVLGNVVVGLGGGYPDGFVERVRKDFSALPDGQVTRETVSPKPVEGLNVLIVEKNTKATAISLGFPVSLLRSHSDFYAMMVANSWLGEHRNSASHLYQVIRDTRGMNYGDYSYIEAYPMGHTRNMPPANVSRSLQFFQIWIRPVSLLKPDDLHDRALFATRAALRELKALVDGGMTEETFETTRGFLKNYTVNYGSTVSRRLGYRIDDEFYNIPDPGHLALIRPELEKLSLDGVNAAIRKHLQLDNMWLIFITKDAEGLKKKLLGGEPTPISYPGEQPEAVLNEDKEIAAFPIPVQEENVHIININEVFEK